MRARLAALPTLLLVLAGVLQATRALDGAPASEIGSPSASKLAQAERVQAVHTVLQQVLNPASEQR